MQTVPSAYASLSGGTFVTNPSTGSIGSGAGPSMGFAGVSPLSAVSQLQNPDTLTPFDPTNTQFGIASDHAMSLPSGFPLPFDVGEVYDNATNRLGSDNLANQTQNATLVVSNTKDLGEPPIGSPMFVHKRAAKPVALGSKRVEMHEVYSLQQLNYLLACESASPEDEQSFLKEFTALGFLLSTQTVMHGTATAVVIAVSGTSDDVPLLWPGRICAGDHLGFVAKYIDASNASEGYKFSETKKKPMPAGANKILQLLPMNFGRYTMPDFRDAVSHTAHGDLYNGTWDWVCMSLNQIKQANNSSKTSFCSVDYVFAREFHELTFGCV